MLTLLVDLLESFLGDSKKHNEDTGQVAFDCPACSAEKGMPQGDGKGNLEVNYVKGKYRCWSCQETNHMHGPVKNLLKKYATPKIIRDYKLIRPDDFIFTPAEKETIIVTLPESYVKFADCNGSEYKHGVALHYLKSRGISDSIINQYDIGFCNRGDFFNRIIIPSYDADGVLNYFIARWFDKKYTILKYLNPQVEKQTIIFNEMRINWDATIYLVEGVTDHIVTPNSIPLLGKFLSDDLLYKLQTKAMGNVVIVLDDDAYDDAVRLYNQLNFGTLRGRIRICRPAVGYDPSKIFEKFGARGIIELLRSARKIPESHNYANVRFKNPMYSNART